MYKIRQNNQARIKKINTFRILCTLLFYISIDSVKNKLFINTVISLLYFFIYKCFCL